MATAARRGGGDPAALRKRTKGPKASAAEAGSGVKRKRVCGSQRAEVRVTAGACNGTTDLDDFEINRLRVYFS
jgi:hypothetical protein